MRFYSKYVLPRLIDLAMRNKDTTRLRAECVPQARGDVLEIGIGSDLNLSFYSSGVQRVYGIDPSVELQRMANKRVSAAAPFQVEFFRQSAEDPLPLGDSSIDTVVMTWTLCSIRNPAPALQQMKRVLKASGRLIFVEHGRAADLRVVVWQDRITQSGSGSEAACHLKQIDELIRETGFHISELKTFYLPGPRPMNYTYQGLAQVAPQKVGRTTNQVVPEQS